jgi:hypothetical protein
MPFEALLCNCYCLSRPPPCNLRFTALDWNTPRMHEAVLLTCGLLEDWDSTESPRRYEYTVS